MRSIIPRIATFLRPKRRWFRFSLKVLLVLVAVICLWLAWKSTVARNERTAAHRIAELGGTFWCDFQAPTTKRELVVEEKYEKRKDSKRPNHFIMFTYKWPLTGRKVAHPVPAWLRRITGDGWFENIQCVMLHGSDATNEDVQLIGRLSELTVLSLQETLISDEALAYVGRLSRLEHLDLSGTNITDCGMAHLSNLRRLELIDLSGTLITDEGLRYLSQLSKLKVLLLSGLSSKSSMRKTARPAPQITDEGLRHLHDLKNLQWLYVTSGRVTGDAWRELSRFAPNLIH